MADMNRRQFFSFAAVAPVALPMAAKAMAEPGGYIHGIAGKLVPGEPIVSSFRVLTSEARSLLKSGVITPNEATAMSRAAWRKMETEFKAADAIQKQMDDDDLFELNCQGDGTLESTSVAFA